MQPDSVVTAPAASTLRIIPLPVSLTNANTAAAGVTVDVPGVPEVTVQRGEQEEESEMRNVFNPGAQAYAVNDETLVKPAHPPNARELVPGKKVSCVPAGSVPTLAVKMSPATVYETAPKETLPTATAEGALNRALETAPPATASAQPAAPEPASVVTSNVVLMARTRWLLRSAMKSVFVANTPLEAPL
jgi:hypothetical protein